jgi:hypothetical protein
LLGLAWDDWCFSLLRDRIVAYLNKWLRLNLGKLLLLSLWSLYWRSLHGYWLELDRLDWMLEACLDVGVIILGV